MKSIYLDYNATTPVDAAVLESMLPFLHEYYGNPSSGHTIGRICQEAIEDARARVASCIGAERDEVIFTSGGTEANNLAILGIMLSDSGDSELASRLPQSPQGHLIVSAIEHPATSAPAAYLEKLGYDVTVVPCDRHGVVSPASIEAAIRPETRLVSVMHANNEVGTIQPIAEIGGICRSRDILFHTDAAQSLGKVRVNVRELNVDLLSVAGHKVYAPKGIGALYIRQGTAVRPILHGAGHERGMRPGTENVAFIVGLGKACELIHSGLDERADRMAALRDGLLNRLSDEMNVELPVHGCQAERLPNTLSVSFPGVRGYELLERAAQICGSTGSACHSTQQSISATLSAMKVADDVAAGTVRLSVGWHTTEREIEHAASQLVGAWEGLK